ncbi:MAG: probable membrane protein YPO3302, partial [uncultured Thiotrichaceae bacterium]
MSYLALFISALLAATFIPAQSETLLFTLIYQGEHNIALLLVVATVGNVLGSVINWWLGLHIQRFRHKKWFPIKEASLEKAQQNFQKYGLWSLLLSWVPIIGDPITMIAGIMRVPFPIFLLLVSIAKGGRYLMVAWLALI